MKTPGQRGPFGRWLTNARTERYETQADALRAYERLAGLKITPSEYAQWESGSRVPRSDNPKVARLYEFYGSMPEPEPKEEPSREYGDLSSLAAATHRQADAIERLTAVLELFITTQAGATQPPQEALQAIAEAEHDLAAAQGSETPHLPRARREP